MSDEYPLPTEHLVKGSVISAETIEYAFGVKRDSNKYQLACLRVIKHVVARFADRGEDVFCVFDKGALRILTDEEASPYMAKRFRDGIRTAYTAHQKGLGADRSQMTDGTRAIHDRSLQRQGMILQAIKREERAFRSMPTQRNTPGLLVPAEPEKSEKKD